MTHVISYLAPLRNGERPSKDRPKDAQLRLPPQPKIRCEYEPGFKTRGIHARPRRGDYIKLKGRLVSGVTDWKVVGQPARYTSFN